MFDIGWTELLVIGIVALIVVGPKDLPGMFRTLGRFTARARSMARDFQKAMESAADDSGVKDMAREFRDAASTKDMGLDDLKTMAKGPKAWARDQVKGAASEAARGKPDAERRPPPVVTDPAITEEELADAEGEASTPRSPEPEAAPRGPATRDLAERRAQERRAATETAARKAAGEPGEPRKAAGESGEDHT